jgi:hypothetical protein
VEGLEQAVGHLHQDRLAGGGDVDLARAHNVEVAQVALELRVGRLKVKQGLHRGA